MQNQRPTAVLVMAILNFVFGALGIFWVVCTGASLAFSMFFIKNMGKLMPPPPKGGPDPFAEAAGMYDLMPSFIPYTVVTCILGIGMAIVLIAAGVGLLKMRSWARWASIAYAAYAILDVIVRFVYTITVSNPAAQKWQEDFYSRQGIVVPPGSEMTQVITAFGQMLWGLAYPIALLVVMFLPHVIAAFSGKALPATASDMPEDYRGGELPRAGGPYGGEAFRPGEQGKWQ